MKSEYTLCPSMVKGSCSRVRRGLAVEAADGAIGRLGFDEIALPRLIIDPRDGAGRPGTEHVLLGGVGKTARAEDGDVLGHPVRGALDLIQVAARTRRDSARTVLCAATHWLLAAA